MIRMEQHSLVPPAWWPRRSYVVVVGGGATYSTRKVKGATHIVRMHLRQEVRQKWDYMNIWFKRCSMLAWNNLACSWAIWRNSTEHADQNLEASRKHHSLSAPPQSLQLSSTRLWQSSETSGASGRYQDLSSGVVGCVSRKYIYPFCACTDVEVWLKRVI